MLSTNVKKSNVVWLNAPRNLEFKQIEIGACKEGEIYCETIITAISPGTELAAFQGLPPLRGGPQYPRLQGYCNVAKVIDLGENVKNIKLGDRILSFQSHCSSFVIKEKDVLHVLKEDEDESKIVCSYLYHLGYNAVLRSGVRAGSKVLIVGMGALGITSLQMSCIAGAITDVITQQTSSLKIAHQIGVRNIYTREEFDQLSDFGKLQQYDVVITTVNGWADWRRALVGARKLGMIAMLGFPGRGENNSDFNPLDPQYVYSKQLRIEAVGESPEYIDSREFLHFNERDNIKFIINCIDQKIIRTDLIATNRFNCMDINKAYESLSTRTLTSATALIDWN